MTERIHFADPAQARKKPACFDSLPQWREWLDGLAMCSPRYRPGAGYCADCTPSYKEKMMEQGRCEKPQVYFQVWRKKFTFQGIEHQEVELIGVFPQDMEEKAKTRKRNAELRGRAY